MGPLLHRSGLVLGPLVPDPLRFESTGRVWRSESSLSTLRSVEIDRAKRRLFVGLFFGPLQGLLEFLLEQPIAVLHGGHLAVEDALGFCLPLLELGEERFHVFALRRGLLDLPVGDDFTGCRVDHQGGFTHRAAQGPLLFFAHVPDLNSLAAKKVGFGLCWKMERLAYNRSPLA